MKDFHRATLVLVLIGSAAVVVACSSDDGDGGTSGTSGEAGSSPLAP